MAFWRRVASSRAWMSTRTLRFQILNPCHAILWFCKSGPSWTPGLLLSEEREPILRQDFHTCGSKLETWHHGHRQEISIGQTLPLQTSVWIVLQSSTSKPESVCTANNANHHLVIFTKWKESANVDLGTTLWGRKSLKGTGFTSFIFLSPAATSVALHWSLSCWSYMSHYYLGSSSAGFSKIQQILSNFWAF